MTAATNASRDALVAAARPMLVDATDEARGIAMAAEEAGQALAEDEVNVALGILVDHDFRAKALHSAVDAARTLLLRARRGEGR